MKIKIVHVGASGLPFGKSPAVNRCLAIYDLLSKNRYALLAINNMVNDYKNKCDIDINEKSGITYLYTPLSQRISNNFFKRRIDKLVSKLNEFLILLKFGNRKKIDLILFYPKGNFIELLKYRFISKYFNIPLIIHYVEYRSKFSNVRSSWSKLNYFLFDQYFVNLVDGVIPISEMLVKNIISKKENLPILKIPPIVNFNNFNKRKKNNSVDYFLYVGSASYDKALELVIDSFEFVEDNNYYLFLILRGNLRNAFSKINGCKKKSLIKVFSNLEYDDLIKYNINAKALLIPLSERIQDKARFPQKISEYLASKNPIITTCVGEINNYFIDGVNALIAEPDNTLSFSDKMNWIIKNPMKANKIGVLGYKVGLDFFNSIEYTERLDDFIFNIINSNDEKNNT